MARVKVIKQKIGNIRPEALLGDDTNDIGSLFNQLLGVDEADPSIIKPKYINLRHNISSLSSLFGMLASDKMIECIGDNKEWLSDMSTYSNTLVEESRIRVMTDDEIPADKTELNKMYKQLKESGRVKALFVVASQLKPYEDFILSPEHSGGEWIDDIPGFDFTPFSSFSNYDLKYVRTADSIDEGTRKFIFKIVTKIYQFIVAIMRIVLSPDVDKGAFSAILLEQVKGMKKHIPRCDEAFDRIADSAKLLEDNFDDYYKGFVQSRESSSMIQSFIIDVAGKQKSSAVLTNQFHKIISFYRKQTAGRVLHPKFQKVMDKLDEAYNMAESRDEEARRAKMDEEKKKKELADQEKVDSNETVAPVEVKPKVPKIKTRKTGKQAKLERSKASTSHIPSTVNEEDEDEDDNDKYSSCSEEEELED